MKVLRYILSILFLYSQHFLFATPSSAITDPANLKVGEEYYIGATTGGVNYYLKLSSLQKGQVGGQVTQIVSEATIFKLEKSGDNWRMVLSNGYYLSINGETNTSLCVSSSAANWTLTSIGGLIRAMHSGKRCLQKYNNGSRFGSYTGLQQDLWFVPVENQSDCKVTWKVNGQAVGSGQSSVASGQKVSTLPEVPTSEKFDGVRKFMGWTDMEVVDGEKPTLLFKTADEANAVSHDVTYHAVFAKENVKSTVWVRQTSGTIENGYYVFVSNDVNHYTMTSVLSNKHLQRGTVEVQDDVLKFAPQSNEIWEIRQTSASSETYFIMNSSNYLSSTDTKSELVLSSTGQAKAQRWVISNDAGSTFSISSSNTNHTGKIRSYNSAWGLYASTQGVAPMLFKNQTASTYDRYSTVASVSVTTNSLGWATFAPAYNVQLPKKQDGVKLYYIKETQTEDDHTVALLADLYGEISSDMVLEAGTGILIKTDNPEVKITFPVNNQISEVKGKAGLNNLLTGVLADETHDVNEHKNAYIFTKPQDRPVGFYPWGSGTLNAGKCYLQLPESLVNAPLVIELTEATDGISSLFSDDSNQGDVRYYDLSGRQVSHHQRGTMVRVKGKKGTIVVN